MTKKISKWVWTCSICKKTFNRAKSQVRNPDTVTCSIHCRDVRFTKSLQGSNNPNYKEGTWISDSKCSCGQIKDCRAKNCAKCAKSGYPIGGYAFTKDILIAAANKARSVAELSRNLGINRKTGIKLVKKFDIIKDYFSKLKRQGRRVIPNASLFTKSDKFRNTRVLKERAIESGYLKNICTWCSIGPIYNGKPLTLQLDHIDGDNTNNKINNLRILCPNCHSQTDTFCGKNTKRARSVEPINKRRRRYSSGK